jgi:hypothetical protein
MLAEGLYHSGAGAASDSFFHSALRNLMPILLVWRSCEVLRPRRSFKHNDNPQAHALPHCLAPSFLTFNA